MTGDPRPFAELRESGLLWLINRVVFHPRGYALALVASTETGEAVGWELLGDGSEVWHFGGDEDQHFTDAEATLRAAGEKAEPPRRAREVGLPCYIAGDGPCKLLPDVEIAGEGDCPNCGSAYHLIPVSGRMEWRTVEDPHTPRPVGEGTEP